MNAKLCKKLRWVARRAAAELPKPVYVGGVPDWVVILDRGRNKTQLMYHRGKCMRGIYLWIKQRVRSRTFWVAGSITEVREGTGLSVKGTTRWVRETLRKFGNPHWHTGENNGRSP